MSGTGGDIKERLSALADVDVGAMSSLRELEEVTARISSALAWMHALQASVARRAGEVAAEGRGPGAAETIRRAGGLSSREARTVARRAEVTAALPSFADALAAGRVSAEHVDVLGRALLGLDESKQAELVRYESALLRTAASADPDAWARQVRGFVDEIDTSHLRNELERAHKLTRLKIWHDKSRMVQLSGSLEPIAGERLWTAIRRETDRLLAANRDLPTDQQSTEEQATARALVNLVAGGHARTEANPTDLVVLVGLERLTGEAGGQKACETARGTRLPAEWVRQMAHEARIIPLVIDEKGLTVEIETASRRRLATFVQRLMLRAMHDTCMVPGCDVPFADCEVHHLQRFDGHNTRLANLGPLCSSHHHDVHDRGWRISLDTGRNVTVHLADGTVWARERFRPPGDPPSVVGVQRPPPRAPTAA